MLTTSGFLGAEAVTLLPRVETMVAVFYFGLFAASFDFISGYTGYLSFGHAVFYGTGAYLVVLAANGKVPFLPFDTPFMLLLLLAGVLAIVLAVVIGLVSFRLSGVYFAMITLGFAQVIYVFVRDWSFVSSSPRDGAAVVGPDGAAPPTFDIGVPFVDSLNLAIGQLAGDSVEGLFGVLSFSTAEVSYYMVGLVVLVCYLALQRIIHSPFGRVMIAIRENEERARAVGYDTFRYKLAAFAVSGFFAGVAGALFAGFRRSVAPDNSLFFLVSGDALLASIIGGFGTLAGPIFGRLFDESVREFLSKEGSGGGLLPYLREHLSQGTLDTVLFNGLTVQEAIETFLNGHASLYLGLLFVLFVLFVPNGLLGTLRDRLGGTVASQVSERLSRLRR
ncbi:branched-chain amino acid ABC transporter permease [Halorarius litoreus]|uniref:branched-chain amino acid ABC transporter permease n=1 Tax=Halorarius litoreus TaxID=2962676 RepID=UPI003D9C9149